MLEAVDISHTFEVGSPFSRRVLFGVSLSLHPGETIVLTGPSGSGKTTLARILAGLERPSAGAVLLRGESLYRGESGRFSAQTRVVLASQYPERQFFANSVWEELSWGLRMGLGMTESESVHRLKPVAEQLDLSLAELGERSPRSLSYGQQRKLALASILAMDPAILILDEPLAGLNARERRRLTTLLRRRPNEQCAMLIVAHELELFLPWVERIGVLAAGRLLFFGPPSDLYENSDPRLTAAVSLPSLIELSRHLKLRELSHGPVSNNSELVFSQVKEALERQSTLRHGQ
jgi:energy-coupling factor transporter ATP-binding protein EcfA2